MLLFFYLCVSARVMTWRSTVGWGGGMVGKNGLNVSGDRASPTEFPAYFLYNIIMKPINKKVKNVIR